ncbi:MAG: 2-oxoacid:acceptor oxidoreductase family protein, partial [Firmicutes bacterium]|nr:2-oxoacid:acceptor oxidoreductase family protein [Bacillota bacterium]
MKKLIIDGNTAASLGAYALSEMAAIYPITPSSTMAENCSEWAEEGKLNIFGKPMKVIEMQSEAGAAGALHGMVSAGALATTFTASQGLLLMIPNMYKLAGELWPCVIHVSARTVATHALSIFGDHGDIYACRQTGFTMLCSSTVQQCYDHAVIAHLLALETSVPVLHFFDGFRTSHEINECEILSNEQIEKLVDKESLARFRARALDPKNPVCQGTTQNPDIFFQNREACNLYYGMVPAKLEEIYKRFEKLTGRRYSAVEAYGNPKAKTVSVAMGSATRTLKKVAEKEGHYAISLNCYRPFPTQEILDVLPKKFEKLIVFDRTKEPNAMGEPLYTEVNAILNNSGHKGEVVGVKYGLGGKDFKPSHAKAVFDNTRSGTRFTIGIEDDVTHLSIPADKSYAMGDGSVSAKFFGLGSDGTVSANKNTIKIIGEKTTNHVQAYFEYDSKKSGSITTSHLRFGPKPIDSPYLTTFASFIGCHNASFVHKIELIDNLRPGGIFVLNTCEKDMSAFLPDSLKQKLMKKEATFYTIDAFGLAQKLGLGNRINVVMQSVFFKLMELMPYEEAKQAMKDYATKTYGKKGEVVVLANHRAVDEAVEHLVKIDVNSLSLSAPKVEEEKSAY